MPAFFLTLAIMRKNCHYK